MNRTLVFAASLIVLIACGKKEKTPPVPTNSPAPAVKKATPKSTPAPAGVPQAFKDRVVQQWPAIEAKGKKFLDQFDIAQKAQHAGDRKKMQDAIEVARGLYEDAMEDWAEISNWIYDEQDAGRISDKGAEACNRFLSSYERKTKTWSKKAKVLKELSTVR